MALLAMLEKQKNKSSHGSSSSSSSSSFVVKKSRHTVKLDVVVPGSVLRTRFSVPANQVNPEWVNKCIVKKNGGFVDDSITQVPMFSTFSTSSGKTFYSFPPAFAMEHIGLPESDLRHRPETMHGIEFKAELRDMQREVVSFVGERLQTRRYACLSACCGFGKTVVGIYLALKLQVPVLIVVHKEFLMKQWKENLLTFTTATDADIGKIQGSIENTARKRFVLATIQTLALKKKRIETGIVIFDEAHHVAAETWFKVTSIVDAQYRLGLSATFKRADGLEEMIYATLGPVYCHVRRNSNRIELRRVNTAFEADVPMIKYLKKPNHSKLINMLAADDARNTLILETLEDLIREKRNILCITSRRRHVDFIVDALGKDVAATFVGETSKKRKRIRDEENVNKQVIIATQSMAAEGLDLPDLDTIVLLLPVGKNSIEQCVGRILRKQTQLHKVVVDFVDDKVDYLKILFYGRNRVMKKLGAVAAASAGK